MDEHLPPIARHEAQDRIGRLTLGTAHDLGAALAEEGADGEPIVVRTGGPHRTADGLLALIDAALADDAALAEEHRGDTAGRAADPATPDFDSQDTAPPS
jgi:hypothetical protein